jgi:FkbM family methyltransferase
MKPNELRRRLRHRLGELRSHPAYRRSPFAVWARLTLWAAHCVLRIPAHARFRRWKVTLYLPPKWSGSGGSSPFLFREHYEPGLLLLERVLKPGMTFVDGGANKGIYTFIAARLVGDTGRVLAFEPGKESFRALKKSLRLNRFAHVVLRRQALSDRIGTARLYHIQSSENNFGLGPSSNPHTGFEKVETITLEQVLKELDLRSIDFLKLDVEGSQELILRSSRKLLSDSRPILLIENNPAACRRLSLDPDGAWQLLGEMGYGFFALNDRAQVIPTAHPGGFRNLVAAHKTSSLFKENHP